MKDQEEENIELIRNSILRVLEQIDKGFKRTMLMYSVAFYFGIFTILFSMVSTVLPQTKGNDFMQLFFGGIGLIDVMAFVIFKPVQDLQKSRATLAQIVSAFLTWYRETQNWDSAGRRIIRGEWSTEQTELLIPQLEKVSKIKIANTIAIISSMTEFMKLTEGSKVHFPGKSTQ